MWYAVGASSRNRVSVPRGRPFPRSVSSASRPVEVFGDVVEERFRKCDGRGGTEDLTWVVAEGVCFRKLIEGETE